MKTKKELKQVTSIRLKPSHKTKIVRRFSTIQHFIDVVCECLENEEHKMKYKEYNKENMTFKEVIKHIKEGY